MSAPEIITFGCRLNTYESEVMRKHATAAGLSDTVIINTCAVTAEAERQAREASETAAAPQVEAVAAVVAEPVVEAVVSSEVVEAEAPAEAASEELFSPAVADAETEEQAAKPLV